MPTSRFWIVAVSLLGLQATIAFRFAAHVHFCDNSDPAWYYATAVNWAQGRGLVDTCLWHFLGPPPTVMRPAGDYWPCGWPLVLGCMMRVGGTSFENTAYMMAGLSLLLPLGVAAMAWRWGLPWYGAGLAGALLCVHADPSTYLSPDANLSYQLMTVAALFTLACLLSAAKKPPRSVWALAGALSMLGLWLRGEGFILWLAATTAIVATQRSGVLKWWSLGGLAVVILQVAYNRAVFGCCTPIPRSAIPWLIHNTDLQAFQALPTFSRWLAQGPQEIGRKVAQCLWTFFSSVWSGLPWPLVVAAAAGGRKLWGVPQARAAIWFMALSFLVPPLLYPVIANPNRLLLHILPLLCALAAAAAVDWSKRLDRRVIAVLAAATLVYYPMFWPAPGLVATVPDRMRPAYLSDDIKQRLGLQPDDLVMSSDPLQVSACLGVSSVFCPTDGTWAVYQAIAQYRPRYLLAHGTDATASFLKQSPHLPMGERLHTSLSQWVELSYPSSGDASSRR